MRALVYHGPATKAWEDVPDPVIQDPTDAIVRIDTTTICGTDVHILKGHVSKDHVHLLVSIPPQVTISRLVQRLKGKTAYKMLQEFAPLRKQFWGRHLWARGYFCCSSGNVTDQVIAEYIANQGKPGPEDFRVEHGDF